jgi:hypothetical protein
MQPTLYIMMREDLQDNTPGKMMAQSAHAQADFDAWVERLEPDNILLSYVNIWKEDRSFGRTLVVSVTLEQIKYFVRDIAPLQMIGRAMSGITVDPTYPWRNFYGKVFLTNEITCAWAFACDATPQAQIDWLKSQSLHQ